MTAYGNLLKTLINLSDSKLSFISDKIGYDVSYISKWCTQDKLPTSKAAPQINRSLADCFTHEIISQNRLDMFTRTFSVRASEESLASVLYNLLQDTYRKSGQDRSDNSTIQFLSKKKEIHHFFNYVFPEMLNAYDEPLEIFSTLEICSFIRDGFDIFPDNLEPSHDIHIEMALDAEALTGPQNDYMKSLYHFINTRSHIRFDFYDNEHVHFINAIIVKNHLAIMCVLNETHKILAATIIDDRTKANEMLCHILPLFKNENLLLKSSYLHDFCRNNQYVNFYTKEHFLIFLAEGFEFFLPQSCWESILQTALHQNKNSFALISQIRVAWEEVFEKSFIEFYLLKSSLNHYIENGEIILACVFYTMTPEERKLHIQNALDILKRNPNIRFYVIDDESSPTFPRDLHTSLYCNRTRIFLKNTGLSHNEGGPMYYTLHSKHILKRTKKFFETLKASPLCYTYNAEEAIAFYEKYATLIDRMIDLGENKSN